MTEFVPDRRLFYDTPGLISHNNGDGINNAALSFSGDQYSSSSSSDNAPDLAVEASPPEREGDAGRPAQGDVDASYYSDYEAEVRSRTSGRVPLPPPPLQCASPPGQREAERLVTRLAADDGRQEQQSDSGDSFYDASMDPHYGRRHAAPSPPSLVEQRYKAGAHSPLPTPPPHQQPRGRGSLPWVDSLRALSSLPMDAKAETWQPEHVPEDAHGLSSSPPRGSHPSAVRQPSGTPPSLANSPPLCVREGTAPPPARARQASLDGCGLLTRASGAQQPPIDPASGAARAATEAAALPDSNAMAGAAVSGRALTTGAGDAAGALPQGRSPPATDNAASKGLSSVSLFTPSVSHDTVHGGPARGAESRRVVVQAHIPGLHSVSSSVLTPAAATQQQQQQQRVVRARAPRGVPLLMQCTGHAATPTRTIIVGPEAESDDDGSATVNVGLHTSAYRETSGMSDLLSSPSQGTPAQPSGATEGRSGRRHTPERLAARRGNTKRSASPFVSFVDDRMESALTPCPATLGSPQRSPVARSASVSSSSLTADQISAAPELVDFSIHTEALNSRAQEEADSVVLCGFSVESFPLSMTAGHSRSSGGVGGASTWGEAPRGAASERTNARAQGQTSQGSLFPENTPHELSYAAPDDIAHGSIRYPEHSRELVPPQQQPEGTGRVHRAPPHPASAVYRDVSRVVDCVEETNLLGEIAVRAPPHLWASQREPHASSGYGVSRASSASGLISLGDGQTERDAAQSMDAVGAAQLHRRRQQRDAVRALLARGTDWRHPTTASHSHDRKVEAGLEARPAPLAPAVYVARQEDLRRRRSEAEAERVRLSLAHDVCRAVQPHGRDLLLMFLLLVEESSAALRRRGGRPSAPTEVGRGVHVDAGASAGSRVTYEVCAEAVNCVLERHGVDWVRATREMCQRVVRWCRRHRSEYAASTEADTQPHVEYSTFVSSVMEFAALYPAHASQVGTALAC